MLNLAAFARISISATTSLPNEVWSRILDNVKSSKDLGNLTLCSHAFHALAIPQLYRNINLKGDDNGVCAAITHLSALTELLLRKPGYARFVRHLSVRGADSHEVETGDGEDVASNAPPIVAIAIAAKRLGNRERKKLLWLVCMAGDASTVASNAPPLTANAIAELTRTEAERKRWLWLTCLPTNHDALLAVLLPTLVNLRSLDLELGSCYWDLVLRKTLHQCSTQEQQIARAAPFLRRLEDIMLSTSHIVSGESLAWVSACLSLPGLKRLCCYQIAISGWKDGAPSLLASQDSASSNIKSIDLRQCWLNDADIGHLLRVPKALQTFIYNQGLFGDRLSEALFSIGALDRALQQQAHSLEHLSLGTLVSESEHWPALANSAPIASLSHFSMLKRLRIAASFIFDYQDNLSKDRVDIDNYLARFIPPKLRQLEIIDVSLCWYAIHKSLTGLFGFHRREPTALELKCVVLEGPFGSEEKFLDYRRFEQIQGLLWLATSTGIVLDLVDDDLYDHYLLNEPPPPSMERGWGMDEDEQWAPICERGNKLIAFPTAFDINSVGLI